MGATLISSRLNAPRAIVYRALLDPHAVATWMVPTGMTSQVHEFDAREGGAFRTSRCPAASRPPTTRPAGGRRSRSSRRWSRGADTRPSEIEPEAAAQAYPRHLLHSVRPRLGAVSGFRGLYLLQRRDVEEIEFVVLTLWESMDAVRAFAGEQPEVAVVEPEARAALLRFDSTVRRYEVLDAP